MSVTMPVKIEMCARIRDAHPCLGLIYRPQPDVIYCPRCGGGEAGVVYSRAEEETA